jgi:inosine/xanthosine triphosphate pyrophosphatase family protein
MNFFVISTGNIGSVSELMNINRIVAILYDDSECNPDSVGAGPSFRSKKFRSCSSRDAPSLRDVPTRSKSSRDRSKQCKYHNTVVIRDFQTIIIFAEGIQEPNRGA